MSRFGALCTLFTLFMFLLVAMPAGAQDDCPVIVGRALESVGDVCALLGRNEACYGSVLALAEPRPGVAVTFEAPGDATALTDITALQTVALDLAAGQWGIAMMSVQAGLPDAAAGQNVTFLLLGDAVVTDASASKADMGPMQAFYFSTGMGVPQCEIAPNNLVIQSPEGARVTLNVNGVEISLGSTTVLAAGAGDLMDILIVDGEGEVTAAGVTETVPAGQMTTVALGGPDGFTPTSAPAPPVDYPVERVRGIPFELLPEEVFANVHLSGDDMPCHVSEPPPQAGQLVLLSRGICAGWPTAEDARAALEGTAPTFSIDGGERLGGGSYQHPDWEPDETGYCEVAQTYWVATPGAHTLTSFVGSFPPVSCTFTIEEREDREESTACIVTAAGDVNRRSGPCTDYEVRGTLAAGASAYVVAQTTSANGYVWWRLANGSWVRSDVVSEAGACDAVPVVAWRPATAP